MQGAVLIYSTSVICILGTDTHRRSLTIYNADIRTIVGNFPNVVVFGRSCGAGQGVSCLVTGMRIVIVKITSAASVQASHGVVAIGQV